ncbi:MAG TPA: filamentous hemagglutinin N-terminal domain-containing protein, partial [Coleofasciculaceae cyanobacterium]
MDSSNGNWRWLWGLSSVLTCMSIAISPRYNAIAQIIPDDTLGNESSVVTPNATIQGLPADLIEGGASRGAALFHSFLEFNVGEGQRVYFANPTGIDNIFSRVTGKDVSDILGTLGINGGANLFFLNPNGIIFGENAQLDVRGSFVATTANSLVFKNGFEFSAVTPEAPPLLT